MRGPAGRRSAAPSISPAATGRASGGAGLGYYRNPDSLHSYVAADRGTWALLAGRPEVADSVLTALLFWRSASGGAAEIFTRSARDFGPNYPPHPTAAAPSWR